MRSFLFIFITTLVAYFFGVSRSTIIIGFFILLIILAITASIGNDNKKEE